MKTRTKNRLIPAGEKSPRIGGLELCSEEHPVRPCTLLLIFGVEETAAELIDLPVELEYERVGVKRSHSGNKINQNKETHPRTISHCINPKAGIGHANVTA